MGGGHSKNVGPDLTTTSFLSPLFQEHPHFRALPYTKSLEESIGKNGCSYFIFYYYFSPKCLSTSNDKCKLY
jgi:hypothetical protein